MEIPSVDRARSKPPRPRGSVSGVPTVNVQYVTRDEFGFVRSHEHYAIGDFLREAESAHRNLRRERCLVLHRAGKAGEHAGVRGTWRYGVHANSRFGELECHRLRDAFDGMLGAYVDRSEGRTLVTVRRGDIDDAAAPLSLHGAYFVLHAQNHPQDIGLERRGKTLRGLVRDRADLSLGSRIVHGDVETAKPRHGLVDHVAHVILLANVGVDELRFRAKRAQLLHERLAGLIASTGHNHLRALLGESDRGGATDTCKASCDQND